MKSDREKQIQEASNDWNRRAAAIVRQIRQSGDVYKNGRLIRKGRPEASN